MNLHTREKKHTLPKKNWPWQLQGVFCSYTKRKTTEKKKHHCFSCHPSYPSVQCPLDAVCIKSRSAARHDKRSTSRSSSVSRNTEVDSKPPIGKTTEQNKRKTEMLESSQNMLWCKLKIGDLIFQFGGKTLQNISEPRQKPSSFPLYWLVNRDPYIGLL